MVFINERLGEEIEGNDILTKFNDNESKDLLITC